MGRSSTCGSGWKSTTPRVLATKRNDTVITTDGRGMTALIDKTQVDSSFYGGVDYGPVTWFGRKTWSCNRHIASIWRDVGHGFPGFFL